MKLSPTAVKELQSEWDGVVKMQGTMKGTIILAFTGGLFRGGSGAGNRLRDILYNLPLLLAFDVLKQTLIKAEAEDLFDCWNNSLGALMDRSKDSLPWKDWQALRDGVCRRNEVAHDGELFSQTECLKDIDRIEAQLVAWGIISAT